MKGVDDKRRKELIAIYMKPLFVMGEKDHSLLVDPATHYKAPNVDMTEKTPKPEDMPDYVYELHLYAGFPLEAVA